ncbi:MAG: metalloregulator ArsR/SmtB family transcription factor [Bacteroidota bacterium]
MTSVFTDQKLHSITETLRAVGHPVRMQIIEMLHQEGPQTVKSIHEYLDLSQPVVSNHLRLLKDRSVVKSSRQGQNSIYQLCDERYHDVILRIGELV